MASKKYFKELGADYPAEIEGTGRAFDIDKCKDLHSAADVVSPLRDKCKDA